MSNLKKKLERKAKFNEEKYDEIVQAIQDYAYDKLNIKDLDEKLKEEIYDSSAWSSPSSIFGFKSELQTVIDKYVLALSDVIDNLK